MEVIVVPEQLTPGRFIEKEVTKTDHARCVDGRADKTIPTEKGPQMLGGTLHPIVLAALQENVAFNSAVVTEKTKLLNDAGFGIGVHGDNHHHEGSACGCGFCDKLPRIITTAKSEKTEILSRLKSILGEKEVYKAVEKAYTQIDTFTIANIQEAGESILQAAQQGGAACEVVEGDHKEVAAFVNLKKGSSFDTDQANKEGWQAFNLDLWAAIEQAQVLGVTPEFAQGASLALYVATEMVLVEQVGKSPLSVIVNV